MFHPAGASLAAFEVVAVVLLAAEGANHVSAGLERLQDVLRLKPSRARQEDLPD
jgi:hypothetical protein